MVDVVGLVDMVSKYCTVGIVGKVGIALQRIIKPLLYTIPIRPTGGSLRLHCFYYKVSYVC